MQHRLSYTFLSLALFLPLAFPAQAASVAYQLDPTHTAVVWHINHMGFSNPSGKWMAQGKLDLDEAKLQDSKVNVIINVADIVTGVPKLDEHLRTADFFDVAKFPIATFVSDKVNVTGKDTANVHGMLTLHGVTKPVTLQVKLNKVGVSPVNQKQTAGFTAFTTIKRSDFGISKYLPGLSDEVKLEIEAEATPRPKIIATPATSG
jgi:polyisoprenoid-binding protein YceI